MGVKWHEVDHLPPLSAKVKNDCSLYLHGKDMGNSTSTFFPFGNLCQVDFSKILCSFTTHTVSYVKVI